MALISMRQLLDHAAENDYGVPAFNVNNLEQMRAIMEGAQETNSPVIVQASAGARSTRERFFAPFDAGGGRGVSKHTCGYASGPRRLANVCQRSIQWDSPR